MCFMGQKIQRSVITRYLCDTSVGVSLSLRFLVEGKDSLVLFVEALSELDRSGSLT